jgi:hypothetical protein
MITESKRLQIEEHLQNIQNLQEQRKKIKEETDRAKEKVKEGKFQMELIDKSVNAQLYFVNCIRNNLPFQTVLTSEDDENKE